MTAAVTSSKSKDRKPPSVSRREFIQLSVWASAELYVFGLPTVLFRRVALAQEIPPLGFFTPAEYSIFAAIARRMIPYPPDFPDAHLWVAQQADRFLARCERNKVKEFHTLLSAFENPWSLFHLSWMAQEPFTQMPPEKQDKYINIWRRHGFTSFRKGFVALKRLVMSTYYSSEKTWKAIGYPGPPDLSAFAELGELELI